MKYQASDYAIALYETLAESKDALVVIKKFVETLSRNNHMFMSHDIILHFEEYYNSRNNIVKARVETAEKISQESREVIKKAVARLTSADSVEIEESICKECIGGVKVQFGDQQMDATILGRLKRLKRQMRSSR